MGTRSKNVENLLICKICGERFHQKGSHMRKVHKISPKEYYDKYLNGYEKEFCVTCGIKRTFRNIIVGYDLSVNKDEFSDYNCGKCVVHKKAFDNQDNVKKNQKDWKKRNNILKNKLLTEFKYECLECGFKVKNEGGLVVHIKKNHELSIVEYGYKHNLINDVYCIQCEKKMFWQNKFPYRLKLCCKNYSIGALKREQKFKETFIDGINQKKIIMVKAAPKIREKILKRISDGSFTPNITNSWCESKILLNIEGKDIYVRSSWEAIYLLGNPTLFYEYIRIPYVINGVQRNYIVDFFDKESNLLIEIKPISEMENEINLLKRTALVDYCESNNYNYMYITDEWFLKNSSCIINSELFNLQLEDTKNILKRRMKNFV